MQSWGEQLDSNRGQVSDFLEQLEKFITILNGAQSNMQGHVTLDHGAVGPQLDELKGPPDYQAAGHSLFCLLGQTNQGVCFSSLIVF